MKKIVLIVIMMFLALSCFASEVELLGKIENDPSNTELRYELVKFYTKNMMISKAEQQMESLVKLQKGYAEYYFKIADMHMKNGEMEKAVVSYVRVLDAFPEDPGAYAGMGKAFFAASEMEKAATQFKKAVKAGGGNKSIYTYLVKCYERLGQFEAVGFYLKKIEELENIEKHKVLDTENKKRKIQKTITWSLTGGIVILLIIFFIKKNPVVAVIFSVVTAGMLFYGQLIIPAIALLVVSVMVVIYIIKMKRKVTGNIDKDYDKALKVARDILGVTKTANKHDIKATYRRLAKKYHPDNNRGNKFAEEKFKAINSAYVILTKRK